MKKVYLLAGALATGLVASAQINVNSIPAKNAREGMGFTKAKVSAVQKAQGDVHWLNDFSIPSDWVISNAGASGTPPHTAGDWAIVNAMPGSLTSQAPSYGFPTAIGSASGGNFALVDSDGAGSTATQNAYLTTATGIDLSALGTTALYLTFTEIYRHYYDENYVQVSNDGGATWTEFAVNPVSEVPVNTNSAAPEYEVVNITPAMVAQGGSWGSDVRIRFRYVGNYDWFWGIDDVAIVEAWNNDLRVANWYQATDVATTNGLDYYMVPQSQTDFPGLTFGAFINNNGGVAQDDAALRVTAPSLSYDETSAPVSLASGATDSVSITTPLMLPTTIGSHTVNVSSDMDSTDANPDNNTATFTLERTAYIYARDNGTASGAISQVQSQTEAALKIGNVMDVFNDMEVSFLQIRLVNQAAAVGQQIYGEVYVFDGADWAFYAETQPYEIQSGDLNNFVTLPLDGGALSLTAGSAILVVAGHYGGATEVAFGMAQATYEGTVQGFTANGEGFNLTTPDAIMIRVSEQPLSVDENEAQFAVNVFPNPAVNEAKVSFELPNTADVTVSVADLSGKVVYTNVMANAAAGKHAVEISTAELAGGVYTVNFSTSNTIVTKKLVVKK